MGIEYSYISCPLATDTTWGECSNLYSNHYGNWSESCAFSPSPGKKIKLSPLRIKKGFVNENASLYQARSNGKLIGYAIALILKIPDYGRVSWVTQLVVHEEYRRKDVAKTLLFSIWGLSNFRAWGIMSANPYAIRALEKATRRRCDPGTILRRKRKLARIGKEYFPFLKMRDSIEIDKNSPKINTEFFVDHSEIREMILRASSNGVKWLLGDLEEGWEWFAFTFDDQNQISLTAQETEKMIDASDQITKEAYSRMLLNNQHKWSQHTDFETQFIILNCGLNSGDSVLDLGCGQGRHSISLASKGCVVTGVDYISDFIQKAGTNAEQAGQKTIQFIEGDCRTISLGGFYDAVIALYDIVGSFVNDQDNKNILKCVSDHLKPDGVALLSVMNYELTKSQAKNLFSFEREPDKLLVDLSAGQIMEQTGNIFDPDYYLLDESTRIVYRKEQFTYGQSLPEELIVRDRRFKKDEIEKMCASVGLSVQWARYVGTGKWNEPLRPCDSKAKEILVLCKKIN